MQKYNTHKYKYNTQKYISSAQIHLIGFPSRCMIIAAP